MTKATVIGLDIAKQVFQVHGADGLIPDIHTEPSTILYSGRLGMM